MHMRNVTTICVCLPAEMAEKLRADAQRIGLSVSSYIKLRLSMSEGLPYAETDSVKVVEPDGSAHQS